MAGSADCPGATTFQRFVESEASGGLLLMASAALGLAMANSSLDQSYEEPAARVRRRPRSAALDQ
jgi:Na+/H+ antiporter NhaA